MIPSLGASLLALLCAQALPAPDSRARESTEAARPRPLPMPEGAGPDDRQPGTDGGPRHPRRARPLDPAVLRALAAEDPPVAALRAAATALVLA
ncbi:MAG TPA: hypothetical protein VI456_03230, partial [Polyangia bacterium]